MHPYLRLSEDLSEDYRKWQKSSVSNLCVVALAALLCSLAAGPGYCQQHVDPPTFESARQAAKPFNGAWPWIIYLLSSLWFLLTTSGPFVALVSAFAAGTLAWFGIKHQRETSRLSHTFNLIDGDLWDNDVQDAREKFNKVRVEVKAEKISIASFCFVPAGIPSDEETAITGGKTVPQAKEPPQSPAEKEAKGSVPWEKSPREIRLGKMIALTRIMGDYENLALGVRKNILDEEYLYRWMRGALLNDWQELSPLVIEYRRMYNIPELYVEFEGLAAAWRNHKSYQTQDPIKQVVRRVLID